MIGFFRKKLTKENIIQFLRKRYIDLPPVNPWRAFTFVFWCMVNLAFATVCDAYMAAYNIDAELVAWLLKIGAMGLTFVIFFTISDTLQMYYARLADKWSQTFNRKIADMQAAVMEAGRKNGKSVRFMGEDRVRMPITATKIVCLIALVLSAYGLHKLAGVWVQSGMDTMAAYLIALGLLYALMAAVNVVCLVSDYNVLVRGK